MPVRPAIDPDACARWAAVRDPADPFGSPAYIEALQETGFRLGFVASDDGEPLALARLFGRVFRRAGVPPLTPYSPIANRLLAGDADAAVDDPLAPLGRAAAAFDDVLLHLPPSVEDVRGLQWSGWDVEPRYTYRLDPAVSCDPERWSSNPRRTFRKHRARFTIREDGARTADVARLCAASYARHGRRPPLPQEGMALLGQRLHEAGMARCFVAEDPDGGVHAGLTLLQGRAIAYYWMAGSEPGPAMTVLIGGVLERLASEAVPVLDLVGANTPSIAEFKRRFNPELVRYHAARCTPGRAFGILRSLRRAGRA